MIVAPYVMSDSFKAHEYSPSATCLHQRILAESNDPNKETKDCETQKKKRVDFITHTECLAHDICDH